MNSQQQRQPWDQIENEPSLWFKRFTAFRLMEPLRTVSEVFKQECAARGAKRKSKVPDGGWYDVAREWHWEERAAAWDAYQTAQQEQAIVKERAKVLKSRYALTHKRIQTLDRLAQKLLDYADDETKVWLLDVKAIGTGPSAERVDLVQFNDGLFREIRAHFADIAAELGERVKKTDTTITNLPKEYIGIDDDDDGSEP